MDFTKSIRREDVAQLLLNAQEQAPLKGSRKEPDLEPCVRVHVPFTVAQWLLTELEGDGMAFGLCDLGQGFPEIGSVWLPELMELNVRGLRVIQDLEWRACKTLSRYARDAREADRIIC